MRDSNTNHSRPITGELGLNFKKHSYFNVTATVRAAVQLRQLPLNFSVFREQVFLSMEGQVPPCPCLWAPMMPPPTNLEHKATLFRRLRKLMAVLTAYLFFVFINTHEAAKAYRQ